MANHASTRVYTIVTLTFGSMRGLLLVQRRDGLDWELPGGTAEPGESGLDAALRALGEETGLGPPLALQLAAEVRELAPRYVPDPHAGDEAQAVTIPVAVDLGRVSELPAVSGRDDARAEWAHADTYRDLTEYLAAAFAGEIFPAHTAMLREFLAGDR